MMTFGGFSSRSDAGRLLGREAASRHFVDPVVLALPRGGVPVALEVARMLGAPMDLLLVRKIGVPWQAELAARQGENDGVNEVSGGFPDSDRRAASTQPAVPPPTTT